MTTTTNDDQEGSLSFLPAEESCSDSGEKQRAEDWKGTKKKRKVGGRGKRRKEAIISDAEMVIAEYKQRAEGGEAPSAAEGRELRASERQEGQS